MKIFLAMAPSGPRNPKFYRRTKKMATFLMDAMLQPNCYKPLFPNLLLCQRQASVMMAERSEYCGAQPKTSLAFFRVGHQHWRIPCPSRRIADNDLKPGNTPCRINHLD